MQKRTWRKTFKQKKKGTQAKNMEEGNLAEQKMEEGIQTKGNGSAREHLRECRAGHALAG